jgi:RHS repeat-associated protein
MGAVTAVALRSGWSAHFDRDEVGAETRRQLPGGVETLTSWDEAGRPRGLVLRRQGDVLAETQYGWTGLDTLQSKSDVIGGGGEDYLHDARGRLAGSRSKVDGRATCRAPSATGNLFKTAERTDRRYGKGGVLLEDAGTVYTYDANGSVVEKRFANGDTWRYAWSAAGRLLHVTTAEGNGVRFEYDALGRRVAKHAGARTTRWLWDGDVPVHEWVDGDGARAGDDLTTWLFEPESFAPMAKVIRRGGATKTYSIVSDYLGTPREMVDEAGKVAWKAQLDVYGVAQVEEGNADDCPWRWPGQYEDQETGLYYNRFRYYDPSGGSYLSQDPIRLAGGTHLFSYTSDPLSLTDPLGLSACEQYRTRSKEDVADLRSEFNDSGRADFLKQLAASDDARANFGDDAVDSMQKGRVPEGMIVHHIIPLFRGGDNSFENLVLLDRSFHEQNFSALHYYPPGQNLFGGLL